MSSVRGKLERKMVLKEWFWNWISFKKYNCVPFKVIFQVNNTSRTLHNTLKWHTLLPSILLENWFLFLKHHTCIQHSQELRGRHLCEQHFALSFLTISREEAQTKDCGFGIGHAVGLDLTVGPIADSAVLKMSCAWLLADKAPSSLQQSPCTVVSSKFCGSDCSHPHVVSQEATHPINCHLWKPLLAQISPLGSNLLSIPMPRTLSGPVLVQLASS